MVEHASTSMAHRGFQYARGFDGISTSRQMTVGGVDGSLATSSPSFGEVTYTSGARREPLAALTVPYWKEAIGHEGQRLF